MPQPFDQIGAPVPLVIVVGLRLEGREGDEHTVPHRQRPAHRQRPGNVAWPVGAADRRDAVHKIAVERSHIALGDLGVGGIRHGRIELVAVLGHAASDRAVEFSEAVTADAGGTVGGDVGGIGGPDRGAHGSATGERLATRRGMAGDAIAGGGRGGTRLKNGLARHFVGQGRNSGDQQHDGEQGPGDHQASSTDGMPATVKTLAKGRRALNWGFP